MRKFYARALLFVKMTLVGCTMAPSYPPPLDIVLPEKWHTAPPEGMHTGDPTCFTWWEAFQDPTLNTLIKTAAQQNLDLLIAGTRILETRVQRKGKTADFYPHLNASLTTGHTSVSKEAWVNGILRHALSPHQIDSIKRDVSFFEVGFDVSWEIDLFGVTRHQLHALDAQVKAAEEGLYDVWVTLSAEIARNYIELRGLQQREQIAKEQIELQEETIQLTKELVAIGIADQLDVLKAEEQLKMLLAERPLMELSIHKAIYHLSILLGHAPGELSAQLCAAQELPYLPEEKPIGLPSELLRRRPDIRKAEKQLVAATALVNSAIAELFPRLSLAGFVGAISTQLKALMQGASGTWWAAPQLLLPIFNSQLLTQSVDLNKIQAKQALFTYQKTVLEALEETENAIASFRYACARHQALEEALKAHQETERLALELYQRGLKDCLELQVARRSLLTVKDAFIQSRIELLLHYISLYKALGGGWEMGLYQEKEGCESLASIANANCY